MSFVDKSPPYSHPTFSSCLEPHPEIEGLFIDSDNTLYTKNLVPGEAHADEILFLTRDNDGSEVEYRVWNPSESKWAAAILLGLNLRIKPGSHVFFSGVECGRTLSHISDIVGPEGKVYVAELTRYESQLHESDKILMNLAAKRCNIVPIIGQTSTPEHYRMFVTMVDAIFATLDSHADHQALEIFAHGIAKNFMKGGGHYVICVKASMGVLFHQKDHMQFEFTPLKRLILNEEHAYDVGVFRKPEVDIIPISKPLIQKGGIFFNEMPTYFLFETACGLSLVLAPHGLKKVGADPDYKDDAKLANRFDEFFQLVCFEAFESHSEGLIQCKSLFKQGEVTDKVNNFLERLLPQPAYDASRKPCYNLVVFSAFLVNPIAMMKNVCVRSGPFYYCIMRAFRMNIRNVIPELGPGDLEKAQREMALAYSTEMIEEATQGRRSKKKKKVQL